MPVRRQLAAVAAILVSFGVLGSPATARAQSQSIGIRLADAPTSRTDDPRARLYIVDHVAPGATITRRVEISNDTNATQAIKVYAAAATVVDGTFGFGEGRAANELTTWTSVAPGTLDLAPGARAQPVVTIAVPATASAGERYAVVWAEAAAAAPPQGGIATVNRVGVRIYLSVGAGGEPPTDFVITTLEARRSADGHPQVAATVRNDGGRAVDLSGELRLTNGPGGLSAGPFDAVLGTTLGVGETEAVLVTLDPALPAGPWDARIALRSGTTQRDATATITFPDAPSSASPAVPAHTGGSTSPALVVGAVVLVALGAATYIAVRRRRVRASSAPG